MMVSMKESDFDGIFKKVGVTVKTLILVINKGCGEKKLRLRYLLVKGILMIWVNFYLEEDFL